MPCCVGRAVVSRIASLFCLSTVIVVLFVPSARAAEPSIEAALKSIAGADQETIGDAETTAAVETLSALPSDQIKLILDGFGPATVRGRNWLRAVAADVADNGAFPAEQLEAYFADRQGDADARYLAYQLLVANEPGRKASLLGKAETDPSLPVRYLKIQALIDQADSMRKEQPEAAIATLNEVVANARSPKQLQSAAKTLKSLGKPVDLAEALGMMRSFQLIGPFDNTGSKHFDTAYLPENQYLETGDPVRLGADGKPLAEEGKLGEISWRPITSDDQLGMVNINEPLENAKDSVAYLFAKFDVLSPLPEGDCQMRIGCINASKVWINGKLVSANEVYHSGTRIDQYIDSCQLQPTGNTVLIKVLQNAQTQPWAQDWQFQFRLTRPDGSALQTAIK